jgi:hypothetical protein
VRRDVVFENGWLNAKNVFEIIRMYASNTWPLLETIGPIRAAWAVLRGHYVNWRSANIKDGLFIAIFQHRRMLSPNMGKKTLLELEWLAMANSAGVSDTMVLHLVAEPFVNIPKVRCIAFGKGANVGAEVRKHVPTPLSFIAEFLYPEAKWAFNFVRHSYSQLFEFRDPHGCWGVKVANNRTRYGCVCPRIVFGVWFFSCGEHTTFDSAWCQGRRLGEESWWLA